MIGALGTPPVERMEEIIILVSSVKAQSRSGSLPEAVAGFPGKKLTLSFSAYEIPSWYIHLASWLRNGSYFDFLYTRRSLNKKISVRSIFINNKKNSLALFFCCKTS